MKTSAVFLLKDMQTVRLHCIAEPVQGEAGGDLRHGLREAPSPAEPRLPGRGDAVPQHGRRRR